MRTEEEIKKMYDFHLTEIKNCKGRGCGYEKQRHEIAIEKLAWVLG